MIIESSFIPFPSEVVVPPAAYKAAAGELNVFLVVLFATLGADIGALINYYLARWIGRPLVYRFAGSRFGHMCLIDREKVEQCRTVFRQARCGINVRWASGSGSAPADIDTGGTGEGETVHVPHIYHFGCGTVEFDIGRDRLLPAFRSS